MCIGHAGRQRHALRCAATIDVGRADVLSDPLPEAELVLANIAVEPLFEVAGLIEAPELVASGYLVSEEPELDGSVVQEFPRRVALAVV